MVTLRIVLPRTVFSTQGKKKKRPPEVLTSASASYAGRVNRDPKLHRVHFLRATQWGRERQTPEMPGSRGSAGQNTVMCGQSPVGVCGVDGKPQTGQHDRTDSIQDVSAWPEGQCTRLTALAVHTACLLSADAVQWCLLSLSLGCLSHTQLQFRESGVYLVPQRTPPHPLEISHVPFGAGDNCINCP